MPKITDEDLEAIQVRLFKADLDYLRSMYRGSLGVNKAIRTIIRRDVRLMRASAAAEIDEAEANIATSDLI